MTEQLANPHEPATTVAERIAEFYDPSRHYDGTVAILERLQELKGVASTALARTVVLELGHAGLVTEGDNRELAATLGTSHDTVRMAQRQLDVSSEHMANAVVRATNALFEARRDFTTSGRISPVEVAGMVLAAHAHHGVERRSGKPFYRHSEAVARLIRIAWDQLLPRDGDEHDAAVFLGYTHDSYEHALPLDNGRYVEAYGHDRVLPSPLVQQKVLGKLGVAAAASYAHTARLLTKTPTLDGTLMDDDYYMQRGMADRLFCLIKLAETHHNLTLDPDNSMATGDGDAPQDITAKNDRYATNAITLQQQLESFGDIRLMLAGHRIMGISAEELQDSSKLQFGLNLDMTNLVLKRYLAQQDTTADTA